MLRQIARAIMFLAGMLLIAIGTYMTITGMERYWLPLAVGLVLVIIPAIADRLESLALRVPFISLEAGQYAKQSKENLDAVRELTYETIRQQLLRDRHTVPAFYHGNDIDLQNEQAKREATMRLALKAGLSSQQLREIEEMMRDNWRRHYSARYGDLD